MLEGKLKKKNNKIGQMLSLDNKICISFIGKEKLFTDEFWWR